jgi:hypothetical protein
MRVAIVGSRKFKRLDLVRQRVRELARVYDDSLVIVSGGASGVDTAAEYEARKLGIPVTVHIAEWKFYGRRAGPIRNARIVDDSDIVIAFWDGQSRGTKSSMNFARSMVKPLEVVRDNP